jgi:type IV pilus assembly protein PilW
MVLSVILMAAVYSTYYSQQKSYLVQEQLAAMEQNLRAAMFYMERDIRTAGCDPTRKAGAGITTAHAASISFTEDADGDDSLATVTYVLTDSDGDGDNDLERSTELLAENIEALDFVYLDGASPPTVLNPGKTDVSDANRPNIRSVEVTVVARTAIEDRTYTDTSNYSNQRGTEILPAQNDHYRRKLLSSNIKFRNLGL